MNWFRQNRFLGAFLVALALATILALVFVFHEKGVADEEQSRLETTIAELNRLRASKPFPDAANLKKARVQAEAYRQSLGALAAELKARTLPVVPLQPNEFQAQLRQAVTSLTEAATADKVKLPPNFYLGFDEYATSLPNSTAAPLLGQELEAVSMLAQGIVAAHVDALTSLTRTPLPEEKSAAPTPTPGRGSRRPGATPAASVAPVVASHTIDLAFSSSPTAARKVLNQVATAKEQLFIIRTLNIRNQVKKGPARGAPAPEGAPPAAAPPAPGASPAPASIHFIVGAEHLEVMAKIEIISLPAEKGSR